MATILLRLARLDEPDQQSLPPVKTLQERAAQCLILGGFATANAYALEAFILHLQSRYLSEGKSSHSNVHLWFEGGTVVRLAIRMGYHRDPSKTPSITPFQAEMRRRVWINIFQVDALISFQMGLPSMIPAAHCDTQPPLNLEYSDFHPSMTTLPAPRPLTVDTPVLYIIAKSAVMATFKTIVSHTQSLASPSSSSAAGGGYDKTIALDLEARAVYTTRVPPLLQRRDVARCGLDTAARIVERANIELLHLKSLVILHRRFITYDDDAEPSANDINAHAAATSRRACVEAALEMLARQADLAQASARPGGRLYQERWMLLSLMAHDFLLAAMVLCLDLSVRLRRVLRRGQRQEQQGYGYRGGGGGDGAGVMGCDGDGGGEDDGLAGRTYRALQTSRAVWAATSALSPEAHTATFALDLMLRKVSEKKNAEALLGRQQQNDTPFPSLAPLAPLPPPPPPPPYTSPRPAPPVVGVVVDSSGSGASTTTLLPTAAGPGLPYADFMANVIDGATAPDWVSSFWLGEMAEMLADDGCRICWTSTFRTQIWSLLMWRLGMERQASRRIS